MLETRLGLRVRQFWSNYCMNSSLYSYFTFLGVTLAFVGGRLAPDTEDKSAISVVPQAKAGETVNLTVKVRIPTETGRHCGYYRLQTKDGHRFGQRVWVDCLAV